jgi:hypothetical protein
MEMTKLVLSLISIYIHNAIKEKLNYLEEKSENSYQRGLIC